nr:pre-rRNA-processing protein TSR2 homolog [Penaeus vannamei]
MICARPTLQPVEIENRQTTEATRVTRATTSTLRPAILLKVATQDAQGRPGELVEMESLFGKAVEVTLKNWNPLQFAVSQQMGGRDSIAKRDWFPSVVEDFFYKNEDLDPDEVADFIATIMDSEFNTLVEDDSDLEVATVLCRFYRLSEAGEKDKIQEELEKMPKYNLDSCVVQDTENETEDDTHEMMTDQLTELQLHENGGDCGGDNGQGERELTELEKQQLQDEADGWTVQRKGRKRR